MMIKRTHLVLWAEEQLVAHATTVSKGIYIQIPKV